MTEEHRIDAEGPDAEADPFVGPDWQESSTAGSATAGAAAGSGRRVKVSRRRKRKLRRRRRIGWVMLAVGGLIVLAGIWLAVTALLARNQLNQVRAEVHTLRSQISAGDLSAARATAAQVRSHAHRAHELTTGPVWALAAQLPAGGEPIHTVRGITASLDQLGSDALPALVTASQHLDPTKLRQPDGTIDLTPIAAVVPSLDRALDVLTAASASVQGLPAHTWLSSIDSARADVASQLTSFTHTVHSAELAARITPPLLGQDGPKNYLVSFETEAELRGTGGLPGAFAIVKAEHGKLSFTRFESDSTLTGVSSGLDFGPAYDKLYAGADATKEYSDSNVSPHFPYAAQIWVAMWHKKSGQHLDGAMAVDPTALSYLLNVTGSVTLPDNSQITAANVVQRTQQTVYARFPALDQQVARKNYQLENARAISKHLLDSKADTTALVRAAGRAAGERRLLLWSADPAIEASLSQTALGGAVVQTTAPYVGLAINNAAANKLDYYADASLSWQRTGCGSSRDVLVTIRITNDTPAGLRGYVLGETGRPGFPQHPGDNRLLVGYYATTGAQPQALTVDGKPVGVVLGTERGHPAYLVDLSLPRGTTRTIVLRLREPSGVGSPVLLAQPMVRPLQVSLHDASCH